MSGGERIIEKRYNTIDEDRQSIRVTLLELVKKLTWRDSYYEPEQSVQILVIHYW